MSGALVLWREGTVRPAHSEVTAAPLKVMIPSSRQDFSPFFRMATRATSLLNSVTYIDRSAAKGLPDTA